MAALSDPKHRRRVIALAGTGAVPHRGVGPTAGRSGFDLSAAFDEHAGALLGFAINTLRERPLAEDCVQETFLRAWRSQATFDSGRASMRTWLFAIERNVLIDALRVRSRAPRITGTEELDAVAATGQPDPLERLRIAEAIAELSDAHRDVIVAVHIRGHSYAEVAADTGVPAATLRTRAYHALRALRRSLSEDGGRL